MSTAKVGPDITASLFVLIYSNTTSVKNLHVSCSIPFVAIKMCCVDFIYLDNFFAISSTAKAGTAIIIILLSFTAFFMLVVIFISFGIL